jgi:hypothetical protein
MDMTPNGVLMAGRPLRGGRVGFVMTLTKRWLAVAGLMSAAAVTATASARVLVNLDDVQQVHATRSESPAGFGGTTMSWKVRGGYHGSVDDASSVAAWNAQLIKTTDQQAASHGAGSFTDDVARDALAAGADYRGDAQRDKAKGLPAHLPEPASWALLICGFGGIGFALRRAHRRSEAKFDEKIRRITNGLPD